MTDARWLLGAGLVGAVLSGGTLEWLRGDPVAATQVMSVEATRAPKRPRPQPDPDCSRS